MKLEEHVIGNDPFWELARVQGDGYDRAEYMRRYHWLGVASWGRDGWDLGDWPYVMVFVNATTPSMLHGWQFVINVEGDTTTYRFDTQAERNEGIDQWALAEWRYHRPSWFDEVQRTRPDDLKGPFSWARLNASEEAAKVAGEGG